MEDIKRTILWFLAIRESKKNYKMPSIAAGSSGIFIWTLCTMQEENRVLFVVS